MRQIQAINTCGLDGIKVVEVSAPRITSKQQVLVAIKAAGINFFDLYTSQGLNPDGCSPCPLGLEATGVIESIGDNVTYQVGDRVLVHCPKGGAFSDLVVADVDFVMPLPDEISFVDGAALTVSYLTAYFALHRAGCLRAKGSVFIHSAAGSVGWAATQLAKQVEDVTILGTASASKFDAISENGVDFPISHEQDYMAASEQLQPGGVTLVIDCLAGPHLSNSLRMLQPFGKVVLIGAKDMVSSTGARTVQTDAVSPYDLIMNNTGVTGLHLNELQKKSPDVFRDAWREITKMAAAGTIKPRVCSVFAMPDAREACRQLLDRLNVGKVVLQM